VAEARVARRRGAARQRGAATRRGNAARRGAATRRDNAARQRGTATRRGNAARQRGPSPGPANVNGASKGMRVGWLPADDRFFARGSGGACTFGARGFVSAGTPFVRSADAVDRKSVV